MFTKTAEFYDALYHFKDYKQACSLLRQLIQLHKPDAASLLDVACGTGKHLEYLKENYKSEGLDLNPDLLKIARKRCPEVLFHEADMIHFNLGSTYDVVVCLFSSIGYVQTADNLSKAVQTMADHLNPGGLLVIEPWLYPEKYWIDKVTANFFDSQDLKISWMYTSGYENLTSIFDIHYMVGTPEGINTFTEQHIMGLWSDQQYKDAFLSAGVSVQYEPEGFFGRGVYYGIKKILI